MRRVKRSILLGILIAACCMLLFNRGCREEPREVAWSYVFRLSDIVFHRTQDIPSDWKRIAVGVNVVRWSKDSKSLYHTGLPSQRVLYRYDLSSGRTRQYWLPKDIALFDVSPDGSAIVTEGSQGESTVVIVDLQTERIRKAIPTPGNPDYVYWLPQDLILVTVRNPDHTESVVLVKPDGTGERTLLPHAGGRLFCSSDGTGFVYGWWPSKTVHRTMYYDLSRHTTTQIDYSNEEHRSDIHEELLLHGTTLLYQPDYERVCAIDVLTRQRTTIPMTLLPYVITFSPDRRLFCVHEHRASELSCPWLWLARTPEAALKKLAEFERHSKPRD